MIPRSSDDRRRRTRRRAAASLAATAAAVAAVVTAVSTAHLDRSTDGPAPAQLPRPTATATRTPLAPGPTATSVSPSPSAPASSGDVPAGQPDTGRITALTPTRSGTTITYEQYTCDTAVDAQVEGDPTNGNQFVCLLPPAPGERVNRPGTATGHVHRAALAPDVVVTASRDLALYLGEPEVTADGGAWVSQLPADRRIPFTDLQRFLGTHSRSTLFRLTFDAEERVSRIDEVDDQV